MKVIDLNTARRQDQDDQPERMSFGQAVEGFRDAIAAAGLGRPEIIADHNIHRFDLPDERRGKNTGWYVFHPDDNPCPAGAFGSFKHEIQEDWSSKANYELSSAERDALQERFRQVQEARKAESIKLAAECVENAASKWAKATDEDGSHPYLLSKQVGAFGLKRLGNELLIPMFNASGHMVSLQRIPPPGGGKKRFLLGTTKENHFGWIGGDQSTIYVAEGYATGASVHMATGQAVVIAFDAGNLLSATKTIKEALPKSKIIIAADNDRWTKKPNGMAYNTGVEAANKVSEALGVKTVVPDFKDLSTNPKDFNDLHVLEGIDAVRRHIDIYGGVSRTFEFIPMWEMLKQPRLTEWLIKGHLEAETLTVLFGESGTMKSFIAMDMGLCVAVGKDWHGNHVKNSGPVFYIAGEGFRGLPARFKAWCLSNESPDSVPFFISSRPAQFLDAASADQVRQAAQKMAGEHGKPRLLIVDTLSRCFGPGDENSTSDMTAFVNALDELRLSFGCAILVVHHSGLADKGRSRGSSVLKGALDFEYMLEKNGDGTRTMHCKKAKDHEEPVSISFKPETVNLGWIDEDGSEMTSCVLRKIQGQGDKANRPKATGANKIALKALVELMDERQAKGNGMLDLNQVKIDVEDWRMNAYSMGVSAGGGDSAKRKAFSRAVGFLIDEGYVATLDDYYWTV